MTKSFNRSARGAGVVGGLVAAGLCAGAGAQWTVSLLNPHNAYGSEVRAVSGNIQVGANWDFRGFRGAVVWYGGVPSGENLPCFCFVSAALGVRDGEIVGYGELGRWNAYLWTGSPRRYVNLWPDDFASSAAYAVQGGQQVGQVGSGASLWYGTAESRVDLSPAGSTESMAWAVCDGQQTGWSRINGEPHASLWTGSAGSWVDLNPAGAASSSADGVEAGVQAGWAEVGGAAHAGMWTGTAESWVDFNPPEATSSQISRIFGGLQLGHVVIDGVVHWSLWSGDPATWEDLMLTGPAGNWRDLSVADFWTDGQTLVLVGSGWNFDRLISERSSEALMWTRPLRRAADFNGDGFLDFFDYDAFVACFEGAACPAGRTADFDGDGFTDYADYAAFVGAYEAGV